MPHFNFKQLHFAPGTRGGQSPATRVISTATFSNRILDALPPLPGEAEACRIPHTNVLSNHTMIFWIPLLLKRVVQILQLARHYL
jgi:hypothetical protein